MSRSPSDVALGTATLPRPDARSVATLRSLALDQVQAARSGHPGMPLGAAPAVHTLFSRFLVADPADPGWLNRDRFVLSAGHASALLYATLHLAGYDLGLDDLRAFRQWGSRTPGHPERGRTPGVEATTGPLGQGVANAVGMAIAETMAAARLNGPAGTVIDHRTFVLASDGDLMEGVSLEAIALAGVLRLGKLTLIYDDNGVVIDSAAAAVHDADAACEAVRAYGWDVSEPVDGEDVEAIAAAIRAALEDESRPSLVRVRTTIGHGSAWAGTPRVHGGPLEDADAAALKQALGDDLAAPFAVPDDVRASWAAFARRGGEARAAWLDGLDRVAAAAPDVIRDLDRLRSPEPLDVARLRDLVPVLDEPEPARFAGGRILAAVAGERPELVGGAADLAAATLTTIPDGGVYGPHDRRGRNIRFGVREHAMGAISNGIAQHGLLRPFASTFLVFAAYEGAALRMAAMQGLPVIHVFTHDSITVGEDGPTHQPIETLAMLRAIPNLLVLRPADTDEAIACWALALERLDGPTALVLARIGLPRLDRSRQVGETRRGGYLLAPAPAGVRADLAIAASGSEVAVAVEAADRLAGRGIVAQVVSLPSQERFLEQDAAYRESVLPPDLPRLVVEAGHPQSLWRLAAGNGRVHAIASFGASAPPPVMLERFGMTPEAVADAAEAVVRGLAAGARGGALGGPGDAHG
jgi:transketolase